MTVNLPLMLNTSSKTFNRTTWSPITNVFTDKIEYNDKYTITIYVKKYIFYNIFDFFKLN